MHTPRRAGLRCFALGLLLASSCASANSLRFFGNGVNDIDRAKILVDETANSNPGPPADIGATNFTIEFWIKGTLTDNRGTVRCGATYGWIDGNTVLDRDRYNQTRAFGISLGNGRVAFGVNIANNVQTLCGSRNVLDGAWHHVAVTRDRTSGQLRLFVDGVADGTATGPAGDLSYPDNGQPGNYCGGSCSFSDPYIVLGAEKHDAGSSYPSFRGFFDELRLSTTLRYTGAFTRPTQPFTVDGSTAALYHLDASSGTVVSDAVGTSHGFLRVGGSPQGPLWSTDTPFAAGGAGTLELAAATYSVDENASSVAVTVERTGGSTGSASVSYQANDGSATPGADFTGVSGTLNWSSGDESPKTFSIPILDDNVDEPDETVNVRLTGASGAALGTPSSAVLTIVDNETELQHGNLRIASSSYTVGEGGGSISVSVTRTSGSDGAVSVNFSTGTGTALADEDFSTRSGTLTWAAGDSATRVITVPILNDTVFEGAEYFTVTISAPTGGAALIAPTTTTVNITDNDPAPAPGSLRFAASGYTVAEGVGSATVSVQRVGGSDGNVSVSYVTVNGTATSGSDYTARSGTLSWSPGDATSRSIQIPILDDTQVESTQSFSVSLNSPTGGATVSTPSSTTVSITDNDTVSSPPGSLQFGAATYQVAESAGSLQIPVRRVGGDGGAVSVSYATSNGTATAGADYTSTSGVLSWATGDAGDKFVTVAVANDSLVEAGETVNLALSVPTGGATLGSPSSAVLTINDSTSSGGGTFSDAFARADSATIGNGWTETDAAAFSISSGRALKSTSSSSGDDALVHRPATENIADVEASIEMRVTGSAIGYPQIFTRLQTSSRARYMLYVDASMARAVLAREASGGFTSLATFTISPSLNTTDLYRLRLRTTGSNPVAIAGYVERLASGTWQVIGQAAYSDSSSSRLTSAGSTGFAGFTENTYWFDNFTRSAQGSAASGTAVAPMALVLWPASASAGESELTVVVTGMNFTTESRVRWNGQERETVFVSPTELEARIPGGDLVRAGTSAVDVLTPGAGISSPRMFAVTRPR